MALPEQAQAPCPTIPDTHYVSRLAYTEPEIFEEEKRLILGKVWRLACHESELPEKHDFRTFDHVGVPLLVIRGPDNQIRSFVNTCSHRGARLVNQVSGNANHIRCFYHHWTYDSLGHCISIPRAHAYEKSGLTLEHCGLREVKTATKYGLVFFNLDDDCMSLDDFLGDALESMKAALTEVDLEVFHFHRAVVRGNWKDWQATNMDPYHELMHAVVRQTNILTVKGMEGRQIKLYPNGHARFTGMVADYTKHESTRRRDQAKSLPGVDPEAFQSVPLFPNGVVATRGTVMRIDVTTPLTPLTTLVEWRGLCVKGDSPEDRIMRINHHNEFWGPCSTNMPEDFYGVEAIGKGFGLGGARYQVIAREENLRGQDDGIMRGFFAAWSHFMGRPASDPDNTRH